MLRGLFNSMWAFWISERFMQFVGGPIIKKIYNVDYDGHPKMRAWRAWLGKAVARNIFHSGFINIVDHHDEDIAKHQPYVFGYTHASNFDPFIGIGWGPHKC